MINKNLPLFLATLSLLAATGCKKDSVDPPVDTPSTEVAVNATVGMHFNFVNGTVPFTLNSTVVQDSLGHNVKLDKVKFYISGLHAFNDEGEVLAHYEDAILLVDALHADSTYAIGAIHASHIHEFEFDLGLEPTTNSVIPSMATGPLSDTTMWFNTTMGHKFLLVDGMADINGDGVFEQPVKYACGMDMLLTPAHAHVHHNLTEGEFFAAEVNVDLGLLFRGIDLATDNMPMMDAAPSMRAMQNLSTGIDGME
ncbi:MAG: MbnP family protein [Flavobacteriales bacterium]